MWLSVSDFPDDSSKVRLNEYNTYPEVGPASKQPIYPPPKKKQPHNNKEQNSISKQQCKKSTTGITAELFGLQQHLLQHLLKMAVLHASILMQKKRGNVDRSEKWYLLLTPVFHEWKWKVVTRFPQQKFQALVLWPPFSKLCDKWLCRFLKTVSWQAFHWGSNGRKCLTM